MSVLFCSEVFLFRFIRRFLNEKLYYSLITHSQKMYFFIKITNQISMKFLAIMIFLVFFSSCDTNVTYKRIIQNDSDYDIWVINPSHIPNATSASNCGAFEFDSISIARKTSYTIEGATTDQSVGFFSDCPIFCLDTLESRIHNQDSLALNKSLYSTNSDWEYTVFQAGHNGACECRLIVNNDDIN